MKKIESQIIRAIAIKIKNNIVVGYFYCDFGVGCVGVREREREGYYFYYHIILVAVFFLIFRKEKNTIFKEIFKIIVLSYF